MKIISHKILALVLISNIFYVSSARAVSKLDFFAQVEEMGKQVQNVKSKVETKYHDNMQSLEEKVLKSSGAEGNALFTMLRKNFEGDAKGIVDNVKSNVKSGNFEFKSALSSLKQKYAKSQLDWSLAVAAANDYKETLATERRQKLAAINQRAMEIKTELELLEKTKETTFDYEQKKEELALELADLEAQKTEQEGKQALRDEKAENLEKKAKSLGKVAANAEKALTSEGQKQYMEQAVESLFSKGKDGEDGSDAAEEESQLEDLYGAEIDSFFLGKYEHESSENIARVLKKRKQEYYKSLQNLMRVIIIGTAKGETISNASQEYLGQTTKADGLYGGMSMKIGADIQNAKIAARYTELLLAEIRFVTMQEMISWNDKFKNSKKDVTKFNLDDYVYKKKGVKDFLDDKLQQGVSGWKGL